VYRDGKPLSEVTAGALPQTEEFSLDSARHVLLVDDPRGHVLEVSTRERWVDTKSDMVTIQNFTFAHAANAAETGAVGNQDRSGWTLQDSKLYYAHGGIVSLGGASNSTAWTRVLRNTIAGSSYEGINGYMNTNTLIQGNTIYDSNLSGFDALNWAGGGMKPVAFTNLTIDSNTLYNTNGPAIWCDIGCNNVTISNNRIHNNQMAPIMYEISDNANIFGNVVYDSQGFGTANIATSAHVNVYNNFVARAPSLHTALQGGSLLDPLCNCFVRGDAYVPAGTSSTDAGSSITIHDNQCVGPTDGSCTTWQDLANDHFGANVYGNTDSNNVTLTGTAATTAETAHGVPLTP
jgi:hypothetical protein